MNMHRKLAIAAVVLAAIPVLAFALLMLFASPDRYRDTLIAEVADQTGATLVLDEPLQWQLWPAGIRAKGLTLLDANKQPLLKAESATASIQFRDLLQGSSGIKSLSLDQVDARVDIAKDGSSNWDSVLKKLVQTEGHALEAFDIRKMRMTWHFAQQKNDTLIDEARLSVSELASKKPVIEAEFLLSRLDNKGGNILLQNTFKTRAYQQEKGWLLKGTRLTSILSSTYIPGQSSLDLQTDLVLADHAISSPGFRAILLYKNMGMPQPEQAILTGSLDINTQEDLATVGNIVFKSSGKAASQLKAKSLSGNWKSGEFSSRNLSFITFVDGKEYATPSGKEISVAFNLERADHNWLFNDVLIEVDESQLKGNLHFGLEEDPHYQTTLTGQGVDAADVAALLRQSGLEGTLDIKMEFDGIGSDLASLLKNGKGKVSLKLLDGQIENLSIPAKLWERMEQSRSLLPDLAEVSPVIDNKSTEVKSLVLESQLADGVVKTKTFNADFGQLSLKLAGDYNASTSDFEYQGQLLIEKSFFTDAKKPYHMPIECVGNLNEENLTFFEAMEARCGMTQEAKRETLTNALRRRFLDLGKEVRQQQEQHQQP